MMPTPQPPSRPACRRLLWVCGDPAAWREALHREAEIRQLADQLFALDQQRSLSLNARIPSSRHDPGSGSDNRMEQPESAV